MKWLSALRNTGESLAVSIAGIKLGDRVLMLGCADPSRIAPLAIRTGLTGRACALDEDASRTLRAADASQKDGALVETLTAPWTMLPLDSSAFDVVIIHGVLPALTPERRAGCVKETHRVLRPGGRCLVIDDTPRGGLGALLGSRGNAQDRRYRAAGGAVRALEAEGFRAVRTVAEREGLVFVEGVKGNGESSDVRSRAGAYL